MEMILYICMAASLFALARTIKKMSSIIKKQQTQLETIASVQYAQIKILKLMCQSHTCNLWKIRQEIYNWKCQWIEKEEYEAAKQASIMVENIEMLMKLNQQIQHETDEDN